jgi:anhydro-N-acetylmuramic acid kinase
MGFAVSKLYRALGLMSGTSLDGIDVALIETDGEGVVRPGPSLTVSYDDPQRAMLRQALVAAEKITDRADRSGVLGATEQALTLWHVDAVAKALRTFNLTSDAIDLIGFHGQTVIHRPEKRLTVQLGDGAALARATGVAVAYDIRAADVAVGGQGAPLVPIYHAALAASILDRPVAFVNIGGVANVTWVGADGALVAFDTGPGNALIDDWMKKHTGVARDEGGAAARSGIVDEATVAQFLGDGYFEKSAPKSLDRNSFAGISLDGLSLKDGAATLVAVTARTIALSKQQMPEEPKAWVICGGGRHNAAIMQNLSGLLPHVAPAEAHGFNGDAMEAEAWAYLAVRCLRGLPISFPRTTGAPQPITGGVIITPD